MMTVEVDDREWARLKRRFITMGVDDALDGYEPPVRITHGCERIDYLMKGDRDDSGTDD